jgi:translation initiation factor IF-3
VERTLPSASSGQALSVASDVDFDLVQISTAASTTVEERRFSFSAT